MNTTAMSIKMADSADQQQHYSLKISEDIVNRLGRARKCHVELRNGSPVAIVIDDYRASLVPSPENQRVELVRITDGKRGVIIEGEVKEKLSMVPEKLDTTAIRQRTEQAERQRSSRKTVKIEDNVTGNSSAIKRLRTEQSQSATSKTAKSSNYGIPAVKKNTKSVASIEDELIHLLAVEDMTMETLSLKLGCPSNDIQQILAQISLPNGLLFKLKPTLYNRVDCANWPKYSVKERQLVARRLGLSQTPTPTQTPNTKQELRPADITRLADQRVRQMMKSTRRKR